MSDKGRVVWTEGMFLRPQHFQQQTRYVEHYVDARAGSLTAFPWGFSTLSLDAELLLQGKISIAQATGVLPDGTPFSIPDHDPPPPILELADSVKESVIYLALPERRAGVSEMRHPGKSETGAGRYEAQEHTVSDSASLDPTEAPVQTGTLTLTLRQASQPLDGFTRLALCRIVEVRTDHSVLLDETFIPDTQNVPCSKVLSALVSEVSGLLLHRADALRNRVSASGRGGSGEIADFLLLQLVNGKIPVFKHFEGLNALHPERLYAELIGLAGEMSTFSQNDRRAPDFPAYDHRDQTASFAPVVTAIRQSLSMVLEQTAIEVPLQARRYGIHVGTLSDNSLLESANFVLAVNAAMDLDVLRQRFPSQVKIGSVETIRQLVNVQLPGIKLRPLPVAPRQVPFHSGFVYFELDKSGDLWKQLDGSGGLALHVGGEFPELKMELWAVRY